MNKAYNKITWQNKPSTATPLNQTNLNEMSNALDTIDDRVIALDSGKVSSVTVTNTLQTGDTIATITVDGTTTNIKSAQVEVDAEPSATSENPLQNKAIYEMLNNLLPEGSESGNPISIDDASGLNAKACSVDLLPIQDLHGYDSPWVGGAGINKLANLKDGTYEGNGVKAVVKGGVATLSGTTTSSGNAIIIPLDKAVTVPNQTCYLHSMNSVQNGSVQPSIEKNGDAPNTAIAFALTPANRITEIPQNRQGVTVDQVRFYLGNGVTLSGTFSPMICLTNTATDFAPYENICPISGRTKVSVTRTGKNLFDPSVTRGPDLSKLKLALAQYKSSGKYGYGYCSNGIGNVTSAGNYTIGFLPCISGATYYIKAQDSAGTHFLDDEGNIVSFSGSWVLTYTHTATSSEKYIAVSFKNGTPISITLEPFTEYLPYQGETKEITLPQTVYSGNVNVVEGGTDSTYGIVDLGTLTWNRNSQYNVMYSYVSGKKIGRTNIISSQYKVADKPYMDLLDGECGGTTIDNGINIKDDRYTDPTAFKTAMNGVQLCYELATPTELTTSAEQISLLKGNNVVSTNGDNIILKYSADIGLYIAGQLQS